MKVLVSERSPLKCPFLNFHFGDIVKDLQVAGLHSTLAIFYPPSLELLRGPPSGNDRRLLQKHHLASVPLNRISIVVSFS